MTEDLTWEDFLTALKESNLTIIEQDQAAEIERLLIEISELVDNKVPRELQAPMGRLICSLAEQIFKQK